MYVLLFKDVYLYAASSDVLSKWQIRYYYKIGWLGVLCLPLYHCMYLNWKSTANLNQSAWVVLLAWRFFSINLENFQLEFCYITITFIVMNYAANTDFFIAWIFALLIWRKSNSVKHCPCRDFNGCHWHRAPMPYPLSYLNDTQLSPLSLLYDSRAAPGAQNGKASTATTLRLSRDEINSCICEIIYRCNICSLEIRKKY